MNVYRLVKEKWATEPLSVKGSMTNGGGRWNPPNIGLLYTAQTPELALLEVMVHLPMMAYAALPKFHLFTLAIPDDKGLVFYTEPSRLPAHWRTGTPDETQTIFSDWLSEPFSLALAVPSVIMDLSYNLLLHPAHPVFEQIEIIDQTVLPVHQRLWRYKE